MKVFCLGDTHFPHHDAKAVDWALRMCKKFKPDHVVLLGDIADLDAVCRFPKSLKRAAGLVNEISEVQRWLQRMMPAFGRAKVSLLVGNHEARLSSFIMRNARELADLPQLSLRGLLGFPASWDIVPDKHGILLDKVFITHGTRFAHGVTQSNLNRWSGLSSVQGHSHRASIAHRGLPTGKVLSAAEAGCLCQLSMGYAPQTDWCHAVVTITNGRVELVRK
ncbi:MAG: metallophosphoesterase [bacterium]